MRTTRSNPEQSPFPPPGDDYDDLERKFQDALVDFLFDAATKNHRPAVVVLQTDDFKGFSRVTELAPLDYAYLLVGCGIAKVVPKSNMRNNVEVDADKFKAMLKRRGLMCDKESQSYCFVSKGFIYEGALKETWPENEVVSKTKVVQMVTSTTSTKRGKRMEG